MSIAEELAWTRAALADPGATGRWRIWRYGSPEIVVGCSQRRLQERLQQERLQAADRGALPVFRRDSGGGVVFAGPWLLGITVVLPVAHPLLSGVSLVDSYRWLGELHVRVLSQAGIPAGTLDPRAVRELAGAGADTHASSGEPVPPAAAAAVSAARPPVAWACFGDLSPWEVVDARGRKLSGLSQRRVRGAVAFSAGTLLSRPCWQHLCAALDAPATDALALDAWTTACDELVTASQPADWVPHFAQALAEVLGPGSG